MKQFVTYNYGVVFNIDALFIIYNTEYLRDMINITDVSFYDNNTVPSMSGESSFVTEFSEE